MLQAKYTKPNAGYDCDKEMCQKHLTLGESYEVNYVSMGQSHTHIYLEGIDGCFNTENFDFYEDGESINIFRDPRYNPYLRRVVE